MKSLSRMPEEAAVIRKISLVGIIGNIILSSFKLAAGICGHSGAMVSDAIHSASDVFTTVVACLGVRLSKKNADKEHPYGHERMECMASLILGMVLMLTGLGIGMEGILHIVMPAPESVVIPGPIALWAAVISIFSKEAMFWYTRYYARLLNSAAFLADAWHHRSDALSSVGSLLGIGGAMLGFPVLDSAASVVICLFILKVAFDILKDSIQKMLDTSCGDLYEKKLSDFILMQQEVLGIDMLHTRMFGNRVYADLEIRVDAAKSLREAHAIAENVHNQVIKDFPSMKDIMIHVHPEDRSGAAKEQEKSF